MGIVESWTDGGMAKQMWGWWSSRQMWGWWSPRQMWGWYHLDAAVLEIEGEVIFEEEQQDGERLAPYNRPS